MSEPRIDLISVKVTDGDSGETKAEVVCIPHTGELISLEDPAACAVALDDLRHLEGLIKDIKNVLVDAIDAGVTSAGKGRTLHLPNVTVIAKKNVDILWDAQQLETDLREAGMSEERIREIIVEEISWTVRAAEAKKAASVNPEYAQAVEAARTEIEKRPSIQVKR